MSDPLHVDWFALAPELTVLVTALAVLFVELGLSGRQKRLVNPIGGVGLAVALVWVLALAADIRGGARASFGNMFVVDNYALLFKGLFIATALVVFVLSYRYFQEVRTYQGEYYFLILSSFLGMLLMPSARDLVMIFIALELVSVPGFIVAGLRKFDLRSNEGALKFFLFGVLSAALLVFGLSIVYGYTGTTDLQGVAVALAGIEAEPLLLAGLLFVIAGFGFKVSAVPFHFWAPDTYEGAPVPVAAFLAVASKAAGFAALLQVCFVGFQPLADVWAPVLGGVAIVTMTLGNLVALQQRNIVRLLAYSSIAHAGYMLVPFGLVQPGTPEVNQSAFAAVLIYVILYAVMNLGAFGVVIGVARQHPGRDLDDYAGLGQRAPGLALAMTIFLVSLGGVPLVIGFWAKLFVLLAAVEAGSAFAYVLGIAVFVNAVISMFYYLAVARAMWMVQPTSTEPVRVGGGLGFVVAALAATTIGLFFVPDIFADAANLSTLAVGVP